MSGASSDGQPLPLSRAPAVDLAPWVSRLFVTEVATPDDHVIDCGLFNDTCYVRVLLKGQWTAETSDGVVKHDDGCLFFGPQSRRMPVSVRGSFRTIGFGFRPGACHALFGIDAETMVDRIVPLHQVADGLDFDDLSSAPNLSGPAALALLETRLRAFIRERSARQPDPITSSFDRAAFDDPTLVISRFAQENSIDQRRLQRLIKRDFGTSPKRVLRRARVLDMASHLRWVADDAESEILMQRYFDQSHLIREFQKFMDQTPAHFAVKPQPILTLALEVRQARRLEELGRLQSGTPSPWEAQ